MNKGDHNGKGERKTSTHAIMNLNELDLVNKKCYWVESMREQEKGLDEKEKEGVRVYSWKKLTPLIGIGTMRKGFRDLIGYTQFFIY